MPSNLAIALGVGTLGAGAYALESGALGGSEKKKKPGDNNDIIPGIPSFAQGGGATPSNYNSPTIVKKTYNTKTEGPEIQKEYNITTNSNNSGDSDSGSSKKEDNSGNNGSGSRSGGSTSSIDLSNVEPENKISKKTQKSIEETTPQPGDSPAEATRKLNRGQGLNRSISSAEMTNEELGIETGSKKEKKEEDSGGSGGGLLDKWASGDWF